MGLPNGFEPWIFIGSQFIRAAQDYVALPVSGLEPSQKAQMLSFIGADRVVPDPQTDNLNPTTNALFVPKDKRKGVSTAVLYKGNLDINAAAVISASGETSAKLKNKDIPNVIADPRVSHFFNTDCISCHTETIRRTDLGLTPDSFKLKGISGIKEADRQKGRWNVRNFGWFFDILGGRKVTPSVAQRTANESSEAAEFINHEYLKH